MSNPSSGLENLLPTDLIACQEAVYRADAALDFFDLYVGVTHQVLLDNQALAHRLLERARSENPEIVEDSNF